ncbi:MAG: Amuc_1099 family pilus-like system protein [Chthoniobacterales bacterium]
MNLAEFFRTKYERIAVVLAALFLLGCSISIWLNASGFADNFATLHAATAPKPAAPPATAVELAKAVEKLHQPPHWTFSGRSGLFVPEKHFIGPTGLPTTLESTEVHPPVPNEWLDQFGLPIADADVLTQDPDADGFTNLEEWQSHTNPTDKNSHPPLIVKLKMKSFSREPFRLVFASRTGDTFGINTSDLKEPTQFLKRGDLIRGTKFRIVGFTEKSEPNRYGTDVDVSELTLENQETKERLNLIKEKIMISPESVANFVYSWADRREFAVKKDQEFSLPPETEIRYKLIDVQPDKAVIVNPQKPLERIEIGLLAP